MPCDCFYNIKEVMIKIFMGRLKMELKSLNRMPYNNRNYKKDDQNPKVTNSDTSIWLGTRNLKVTNPGGSILPGTGDPEVTNSDINPLFDFRDPEFEKEYENLSLGRPRYVELSPEEQIDVSALLADLGEEGKTYNGIKVDPNPDWINPNKGTLLYSIPGKLFRDDNSIPIMLSADYENGKITRIARNIDPEALAVNLALYGNEQLPLLDKINEFLGLPEPTEDLINKERILEQRREQERAELAKVTEREGRWISNDNGELVRTNQPRNSTYDIRGANEVLQGQYSIKQAEDSRYMQTFGIGPCVALTLYDNETRTGVMAHIDSPEKVENSTPVIIRQLQQQGIDPEDLEARIIGGRTELSEEIIRNLNQSLSQYNVPIVEEDILGNSSRAIMMDLNDGEVYDYLEDKSIQETLKVQQPIDLEWLTKIGQSLIRQK